MDKRDRSTNFSSAEIKSLIDIILLHKHVIENKKTDAVTTKEKNNVWEEVTNTFNAVNANNRTIKCLKTKYDGIKKNLRKKMAEERRQLYATGGGPQKIITFEDFEEKLMPILRVNIEGLPSVGDSDFIQEGKLILIFNLVLKKVL